MLDDKRVILNDFNPQFIAQKIAKRLKNRRLKLNLTQGALAKRSGVSLGSLKRFENQSEISLKSLLFLALVLEATEEFHELFTSSDYDSIDDVLEEKQVKYRKRGRIND